MITTVLCYSATLGSSVADYGTPCRVDMHRATIADGPVPFRYSLTLRLNFNTARNSSSASTITSDESAVMVALTTMGLARIFSSIKLSPWKRIGRATEETDTGGDSPRDTGASACVNMPQPSRTEITGMSKIGFVISRPFNTVLARLGLVAAVLATLLLLAPAATAATSVSYEENDTAPVATFSATDQDGDAIVWSLAGVDAALFDIDGGVLTFTSPPNYEGPKSKSVGTVADKNVYNVTVQATGGSEDVIVTVTNVDEDGSISFTGLGQFQPQVGRGLEALLNDPDGGVTDEAWQWARSMDMETWTDIDGATTAKRSPAAADEGYYLRASVTYTDLFGSGKSVARVTGNSVEERTVSNAAPSFADQDDRFDDPDTDGQTEDEGIQVNRSTVENSGAGVNIGKPVSASDGDNDTLVYTLSGNVNIDGDLVAATTLFGIVASSGQLKAKAKLDFEGGQDNNPTNGLYNVMVTATDPSGAATPQAVTITLTDANEAPAFELGANVPKVVNVMENDNTNQLRVGPTGGDDLSGTAYNADDEDVGDPVFPAEDNATLALDGADKKYFEITNAGALTIVDEDAATEAIELHTPDFETKSSYSIAIVATSGAADRTRRARLEVTVHVIDTEDPGTVSLPQLEPQVGRAVVATVSDPDGGVTLSRWTWSTAEAPTGADQTCADAADNDFSPVSPDVSSGAYTPKLGDAEMCLRATATYTDNIAGNVDTNDDAAINTETVGKVSEKPVQISDPANTAPKFPDQDLTAQGDQSDTASRSVVENKAKENVGGPIFAEDGNTDAMLYTVSGDDAAYFSVDNNGQIKTKVELDYETKDTHMVALTATDPSGASDTIMVTVTVTDDNDNAVITGSTAEDYDENAPVRWPPSAPRTRTVTRSPGPWAELTPICSRSMVACLPSRPPPTTRVRSRLRSARGRT